MSLADVFEKFISTCLEYYGLDLCHYFSSPGFSWDAMLKMTRIELGLISDIDMYLFIKKGMRGGISCITKKYSIANSKYMQSYDNGWTMSQYLSFGRFKWLNKKFFDKFDVNSIECNFIDGCVLEVDLEYLWRYVIILQMTIK